MTYKKFYSQFYDLIYSKKNYKKEVSFIINLIKKKNIKVKKILELGSGTGSHGRYIKKLGYDIIGVEKSTHMIQISKKKKVNFKIYNFDLKKFRINKKFDLVLSLFHVINYMTKDIEVTKFFYTANYHLKKGGYFIFDTWHTPGVRNSKPFKTKKIYSNNNYKIEKKAAPLKISSKIYDIIYNFRIFNKITKFFFSFIEQHRIRHFTIEDLIKVGEKKGFEFVSSHKQLSMSKPNKYDWGATLLFKKS